MRSNYIFRNFNCGRNLDILAVSKVIKAIGFFGKKILIDNIVRIVFDIHLS